MPLQYELEALEDLITSSLNPKNVLNENEISNQQFDHWNGILLQEKEAIRKRLKKVTYSYTKENHRKLYIQQHQQGIYRLKNTIVDFLMPKDASAFAEQSSDSKLVRLYKRCLAGLQELTAFLKDEFRLYFNDDARVPVSRLLIIQLELKPRITAIRKYLGKGGHDPALIELVLQSILINCNNETCMELTYRRYGYIKFLLSSLEKVNPEEIQYSHYSALPALLVYLNFNATVFKNYMVKQMHAEINAAETIEKKIETISFHHKEISQLVVKPGMSLAPTLHSVQLDLVTWLFTEMTHLEKKQTLGIVAPIHFKDATGEDGEKGIYSTLTVEELALLFKALKETGVLKNKNMKQVVRTIAEDWHTKQKENISWQYLYNSMSTIEANTVNSLDSKMMDVVNWLRKLKSSLK